MSIPLFLCFLFRFDISSDQHLRNLTNHIELGLWHANVQTGSRQGQCAIGHG